jgi:hypothetical protein
MSEEFVGLVVGQVVRAIDEASKLLNMPSNRSQVQYGAAVVLGVAVAAAVTGGIAIYFSDG